MNIAQMNCYKFSNEVARLIQKLHPVGRGRYVLFGSAGKLYLDKPDLPAKGDVPIFEFTHREIKNGISPARWYSLLTRFKIMRMEGLL